MKYSIQCDCQQRIDVSAGDAGATLVCECGKTLMVPNLTDLQAASSKGVTLRAILPKLGQAPDDEATEFLVLLTQDDEVRERVHWESFFHFVAAFDQEIRKSFSKYLDDSCFQVACALLPNQTKLIEIQVRSDRALDMAVTKLKDHLQTIQTPPINNGPVSFVSRIGVSSSPQKLVFPFASILNGRTGNLDELLMQAAGLKSDERNGAVNSRTSWWQRIHKLFMGERTNLDSSNQEESPVDPRSLSIDELTDLINMYPDNSALVGYRADQLKRDGNLETALKDYDRLVELQATNPDAYVARGEVHCMTGSLQNGLADFSTAIRLDPNHVDSHNGRGIVLLELEAWDKAAEDFDYAISLAATNPNLHINRGRAMMGKQNTDSAIESFSEALLLDPHNEEAFALRAICRRIAIQVDDSTETMGLALADFDNAIRLNPSNVSHHLRRAEIRLMCDLPSQVIEDCEIVLKDEPDSGAALALRGMAHQRLGNIEQSMEDTTRAIDLGVETPDLYLTRAAAYDAEESFEQAVVDLESALDMDPTCVAAYNHRATIHLELQEYEAAIKDLDEAILIAPDWPLLYANRGNANRALDRYENALLDFNKAIELDPNFVGAYITRGITFAELDRFDDALADLDKAVEIDSESTAALFNRANIRLQAQDFEGAKVDLSRVIELDPTYAPAYYNRANIHIHNGDLDDAIDDFDELIHLCPTLGAAYSGRANVWIQKGQDERASDDYREAVQCDPESAEAYLVQRLVVEAAHHHRQEEFSEAINKATEALDLDEDCIPAISVRAAAYWFSEQLVEGVEDYTRQIDTEGGSFSAYCGRGQVYAEMGEFELALTDLNVALDLGADSELPETLAYVYSGRGLAHAGLGDNENANRDFELSVTDCPQNAGLFYNQGLAYYKLGNMPEALRCLELALELTEPALSPRKRSRAKAFVSKHRKDEEEG